MKNDINNPKHYLESSLESIECMLMLFGKEQVKSFCLLNAFKYIWRYKNKNGIEDLKKARWYLSYYRKIDPNEAESNVMFNNIDKFLLKITVDYNE
jgi:Protein of unknwon function (DUF3310).